MFFRPFPDGFVKIFNFAIFLPFCWQKCNKIPLLYRFVKSNKIDTSKLDSTRSLFNCAFEPCVHLFSRPLSRSLTAFFFPQIAGLLMLMLLSWLVSSLILMLFPVWFGRKAFSIFFSTGETRVYELYTSATGIYTCILLIRGMTLLTGWIQQGWAQMSEKVKEWTIIVSTLPQSHT